MPKWIPHLIWAPHRVSEEGGYSPVDYWCADAEINNHTSCGLSTHRSIAALRALWNVTVLTLGAYVFGSEQWVRFTWRPWSSHV